MRIEKRVREILKQEFDWSTLKDYLEGHYGSGDLISSEEIAGAFGVTVEEVLAAARILEESGDIAIEGTAISFL